MPETGQAMDEKYAQNLGAPDITLEGLQIWIHGRQFPKATDYWDGNWLNVTAHCGDAGASVWANGPIVHLGEISRWHSELEPLQSTLKGEAKLDCMEPALHVSLKSTTLGHITMEVSITPNHMSQRHWFQFEIDQSYLLPLLQQCGAVLQRYPIIGKPE